MIALNYKQERIIVIALKGLPASVRADCHKFIFDTLRPIPRIEAVDVHRAVDAALSRYVGGRRR